MAYLGAATVHVPAQQSYITDMQSSTMMVSGTSNLHGWEMEVRDFTCTLDLSRKERNIQIQSVRFTAISGSIESRRSIMNKKTHDALMADRYPEITFRASSTEVMEVDTSSFKGSLSGDLLIAGKTSRITLTFSGELLSGGDIRVSGFKELRMSDYNIDPPTAILGTLKTDDEVNVSFDLVFEKEE